jgi:hypothetical protein
MDGYFYANLGEFWRACYDALTMRPRLRSVLYFLFLAGFFVAAPLIVLYTAGYRVNFESGRLTGAGVLSATSVPRGALVLLDGERRARTPDVIDDVPPGKHVVRLERDGYIAWEKRLDFPARQTIFINDAVLYLNEEATVANVAEPSAVTIDAGSRHLAYVTTMGPWTEVWARDASEDKAEIMARLPSDEAGEVSLAWSRDGSRLLISSQGGARLSVVATGAHNQIDPASLIAGIEDAWWDAGSDATLFVRVSGTLHAIDASNGSISALPLEADTIMSGDGGHYLVEEADGRSAVTWRSGESSRIVAYLPSGTYAFKPSPDGLLNRLRPARLQRRPSRPGNHHAIEQPDQKCRLVPAGRIRPLPFLGPSCLD